MKAQIAVEYLIIVGFVLFMMIPLLYIFYNQSESAKDKIVLEQTQQTVKKIADYADAVYSLGEGNQRKFDVTIPPGVQNITISGRQITFSVMTAVGASEISQVTKGNVSGSFSKSAGIMPITVTSMGDYVKISEG